MKGAEETTDGGFVYLITNRAWPGWVKTGRSVDPHSRLSNYQTGDPTRSYKIRYAEETADAAVVEPLLRDALENLGYERSGEWFRVPLRVATRVLSRVVDEFEADT